VHRRLSVSVGALLAGVIALLAAGGSAAASAGRWVAHDLGAQVSYDSGDGGLYVGSDDGRINERGQVVGATWDGSHARAFLWEHGQLRYLGVLPGDTDSSAVGVNDRGQIVAVSWKGSAGYEKPRAFLWESGKMRALGPLDPSAGGGFREPRAGSARDE
jgi:probable HAF family extracellular repeat protein